jgi:hypothetical protein
LLERRKNLITNEIKRTREQEIILEELDYLSQFVTEEVPIFGEGNGEKISGFFFDYSKEQFELHNGDTDRELSINPLKRLIAIFNYDTKKEYLEILDKYSVNDLVKTSLQKIRLELEGGKDFTKEKTAIQFNLDVSEFIPLKQVQEMMKKLDCRYFDQWKLIDFKQKLSHLEGVKLKTDWLKLISENLEFERSRYQSNFTVFRMEQDIHSFFEKLSNVCGGEVEGIEFLKSIIPLGNFLERTFFYDREMTIILFQKIGVKHFSKEEIIYLYKNVYQQMISSKTVPIIAWKYFWEHQENIFSQKNITEKILFEIQVIDFVKVKEYFNKRKEEFPTEENYFEKFILNNKYLDLTIGYFRTEDIVHQIALSGLAFPLLELLEDENLPDHIHFDDFISKNKLELINFLESGLKLRLLLID